MAPAILINASGGNAGYGHLYGGSGQTVGSAGNAGNISLTLQPQSAAAPSIQISSVGANSPAVALIANGGSGGGGGFTDNGSFINHWSDASGGGNAGNVSFTTYSAQGGQPIIISTSGDHSGGILAQSIGGQGGYGGYHRAENGDFGVGNGGNGGAAGIVTIKTNANISTAGNYAVGIRAISSGGNGGQSGITSGDTSGNGGTGLTTGFAVEGVSGGTITTKGAYSSGIYATSIGGTGANGVESSQAGKGAPSGQVSVQNTGAIVTSGDESHGIFASSFGGGGGAGGSTDTNGAIFIFAQGGQGANGAKGGYT